MALSSCWIADAVWGSVESHLHNDFREGSQLRQELRAFCYCGPPFHVRASARRFLRLVAYSAVEWWVRFSRYLRVPPRV